MFVTFGCFQSPFRDISVAPCGNPCMVRVVTLPSQMKELELKVTFSASRGGREMYKRQIYVMNLDLSIP